MDFAPALRTDLHMLEEGDVLYDPVLDRRVNLGPLSRALVERLARGPLPVSLLVAEVAGESEGGGAGEWDRGRVERALRALMLMNLIEGAGEEILAKARALRSGERPLTPVPLGGVRFGCLGTGDCCRSYTFGPLTEADHERLKAHEGALRERLGPAERGGLGLLAEDEPYLEERRTPEGVRRYLRSISAEGMRCVFHLPDGRCGVHAAVGAAAKPGFCQLFPYEAVATIDGLRIYDRGECANYGVTSRRGLPLAQDLDRVLALLSPRRSIEHPLILLHEGVPCDYGHFLQLQDALCALVMEKGPAGSGAAQALWAVGAAVRRFGAALASCPLQRGEPDRTVAAQVSFTRRGIIDDDGEGDAQAGWGAVGELAEAILGELRWAVALSDFVPAQRFHFQHLKHFAAAVALLRQRALLRAEPPGRAPAAEGWMALAPLEAERADLGEVLRRSLRSQLFGRMVLIQNQPVAGLLRLAFGLLLTVTQAQAQAAERGAAGFDLADLNAGHKMVQRTLTQESLERVFVAQAQKGVTWDVLAALRGMAPAI
jgi:hypothetical protein